MFDRSRRVLRRIANSAAPPPLLRRRNAVPGWLALGWRMLLAFALIGIALAVHWFDRAGLRDNIDGHISFPDVLYFTMITVTTVGYGDIVPVTVEARLFDTFVVTPIRLFVWLIFLGTAYDFVLRGVWERWRMGMIQQKLHGHIVVAGYGATGAEAVHEMIQRGAEPGEVVVVETDTAALRRAEALGLAVVEGDATRNDTLAAVRIANSRALVVSAGRDDTAILIVLTARCLAPDVPISVVIRSEDNEQLARQAGANTVINPASFAGLLLAGSIHGRHIADYIADLANAGGRVTLNERTITPDEVGASLGDLRTGIGLRIYRGNTAYGFGSPQAGRLEAGDVVVEVLRQP